MKSILSNERECYVCGYTETLNRHHIYAGVSNRKQSEKYGCWVYLCARHHNMSDVGVHFNKALDTELKQTCQKEWEKRNGTREDFIRTFGRSYL